MQPTILIADDEPHLTRIVAMKLGELPYQIVTAHNGERAFALAQEHLPSLIVSDFEMPQLDGVSMCIRLCETEATRETPVILLTARGHKISKEDLARTNIRFVLDKPFSSRDLVARVREVLGLEKSQAE